MRSWKFSASFVTLFVCASALHATVLVPAEFREVVNGSDLIAYGRVVSVAPVRVEGQTRIDSLVTFEVGSWLKGGGESSITFWTPGGQLGRYRSVRVGAPTFNVGDEAVMFLTSAGQPVPTVFGMSQGVFRVRRDPDTGERMVVPPPLLAAGNEPQTLRRGDRTRQPVPLDTFGAQVRSVMAEPRGAVR
jgi:hypothetical protein